MKMHLLITNSDGSIFWDLQEDLDLINIPGAWAILRKNPRDGEKKGYGEDRGKVIIDWLYKNHGPKQMCVESVPRAVVESCLKYADNQELSKLFGRTLLQLLQEKFGKEY
ncbi:MAG: hypothetical protein WC819_03725 [Parcubacteria group bacterium]|jgi:hypothetical protein